MKIIDLLNKVANGEEVPKEIYFCGRIYELDAYNHYMYEKYGLYEDLLDFTLNVDLDEFLNDEVKIIEEEKEIEKLRIQRTWQDEFRNEPLLRYIYKEDMEDIENKINELIDEIKKLKEN